MESEIVLARAYLEGGQDDDGCAAVEKVNLALQQSLPDTHTFRLHCATITGHLLRRHGRAAEVVAMVGDIGFQPGTGLNIYQLRYRVMLAKACKATGQIDWAIERLQQFLEVDAPTMAPDDERHLDAQRFLADLYSQNHQTRQAVDIFKTHVSVLSQRPPHDRTLLRATNDLALALRASGKRLHAIKILEDTVRIREEMLAVDDLSLLASQYNLAVTYRMQGELRRSIHLLEYLVRIEALTLAENHFGRLCSQHELAESYLQYGQRRKAIRLLKHVVRIERETLRNDMDRVCSLQKLAFVNRDDGQAQKTVDIHLERNPVLCSSKTPTQIVLQTDEAAGKVLKERSFAKRQKA